MISIIICSVDETKFRKVTEDYQAKLQGESFEIIGIHDAKSLCEGYNRGIDRSRGEILIFSHDDIEILSQDFAKKLTNYLFKYDVIGVAGTSNLVHGNWTSAGSAYIHGQVAHLIPGSTDYLIAIYGARTRVAENIHALDGLFFAVNRRVTEKVRFDERTFDDFHFYDLDFTFSAYLKGFKLAVCNDVIILHHSRGTFDKIWEHYRDKFLEKHKAALTANMHRMHSIKGMQVKTKEEILAACEANIGRV
jgi:GT2 family glycosyltransferase